jgi:hypothetical protein
MPAPDEWPPKTGRHENHDFFSFAFAAFRSVIYSYVSEVQDNGLSQNPKQILVAIGKQVSSWFAYKEDK